VIVRDGAQHSRTDLYGSDGVPEFSSAFVEFWLVNFLAVMEWFEVVIIDVSPLR